MWKDGVKEVVKVLLSDALEVYGRREVPLRRAKVMVKCMEFMYHSGLEGGAAMGWDLQEMGKEIEKLEGSEVCPL
jgi:separase